MKTTRRRGAVEITTDTESGHKTFEIAPESGLVETKTGHGQLKGSRGLL